MTDEHQHQHHHDPTFYRSSADAAAAPPEKLAYLATYERFFPEGEAFRGRRVHQVRLQGGDASSDSYCFPS
jgi:hypothetical protein